MTMRNGTGLKLAACLVALALILLPTVGTAFGAPGRQGPERISYGQTVQGAITQDQYYHVYIFSGSAGDVVTITMQAVSGDLDCFLILMDSDQNEIASNDDDPAGGTLNSRIARQPLPYDGEYLIVATRFGGEGATTTGNFELSLILEGRESPGNNSVTVTLTWDTPADLDLALTEPGGEMIFYARPESLGGAVWEGDGNDNCEVISASPWERVSWPRGNAPAGVYQVLVNYAVSCDDAGPTNLTVRVEVNGQVVAVEQATLNASGETYTLSFTVQEAAPVGPGAENIFWRVLMPEGVDEGNFAALGGLDVAPDGTVYVADNAHGIWAIAPGGNVIGAMRPDGMQSPGDVAVGPGDYLFVADWGAQRVLVLDRAGNLVGALGEPGDAVGQFPPLSPQSLAVAPDGTVYAGAEYAAPDGGRMDYVLVFAPTGELIATWYLNEMTDYFGGIPRLTLGPDGNLYLLNPGRGIIVISPGGVLLNQDLARGELLAEQTGDIAVAPNGVVYVTSWSRGVLAFGPDGTLLGRFGEIYEGSGEIPPGMFASPAGVTVGNAGEVIVTDWNAEYGQVVAFGFELTGVAAAPTERADVIRISYGDTVRGQITDERFAWHYIFDGDAGDVISIRMRAISGPLDSYLILRDSAGNELISNDDDPAGGTFDAYIDAFALPADDTYTIVATRYGEENGGTTGEFELTLTRL